MPATIQMSQIQTIWRIIELCGLDPEPFFNEEGISTSDLATPEKRILRRKMDSIWKRVAEAVGDPCIGLKAGEAWHPSHAHALGYMWLATSSLRKGLERMARYSKVWLDRGDLFIEQTDNGLAVTLSDPMMAPYQIDAFFSGILKACRINFGENLTPLHVELTRPAPPCAEKYHECFSSDVRFKSHRNCMMLSNADVERTLYTGNELMADLNEKMVSRQMREMNQGGIIRDVEIALSHSIGGKGHSDELIASKLNMSTRTLQRKLKEAGTTYRKVLDGIRGKMADEYLQDNSLDLLEVAFLLGYSEYSSFSRAYKRWTGTSPQEQRAANV